MKLILFLLFTLTLTCCKQQPVSESHSSMETTSFTDENKDAEIQALIRKVLTWANSENTIELLPAIADSTDSIYIGFNLDTHERNLDKLRESNLFASTFITNYDSIIKHIDAKLKTRDADMEQWFVGIYPPFNFSKDANPWCSCQDVPYDTPSPWKMIEIEELNTSAYLWKWGDIENELSPDWSEFRYRFEVRKEDGNWKISYMEGFEN